MVAIVKTKGSLTQEDLKVVAEAFKHLMTLSSAVLVVAATVWHNAGNKPSVLALAPMAGLIGSAAVGGVGLFNCAFASLGEDGKIVTADHRRIASMARYTLYSFYVALSLLIAYISYT
jgi:hypothetical protein